MKKIFVLCVLFLACNQSENNELIELDFQEEIVELSQYIITKASIPPTIDGKGNDESWKNAQFSKPFIDIEGKKKPKFNTRVKMLWDDLFLYVYAEMEEPHIWGNLRERDTVIFYNNDFEVFISPSGATRNYGEIEINSLGTVWDLLLDRPYRDQGRPNNHWNLNDLKSAIHVYGTLNDASDIDSLWTVEMAIPMPTLLELKGGKNQPNEGEKWRINFSRVEWDYDLINNRYSRKKAKDGTYLPEYNWVWSNQNTINMHEPEKWGVIQFTQKSSSTNIDFIPNKNDKIKQIAFTLYRQTKFGKLRKYLEKSAGYKMKLKINYGENIPAEALFYKTNYGFEYRIQHNDATNAFLINESGILKTLP